MSPMCELKFVSNLYDHKIPDSYSGCMNDNLTNSGTMLYENIQVRE